MKKYVIALSLPENSDVMNVKEVKDTIIKSFSKDGKVPKDVVILNLNHVDEKARDKYINMGGIDCFLFNSDTIKDEVGKSIISKAIVAEDKLQKNTQFINLYNGENSIDKESAGKTGDVFEGKNLTHVEISDMKLLSQNLQGRYNSAIRQRAMIVKSEEEVLELANAVVHKIEEKGDDGYTSKHIRSVCMIAEQIAKKMGCSKDEIDILKIGALLHDIGKDDISIDVLGKPSKLDDNEFQQMKQHVELGELELNQYDLGKYERAKDIAASHHERFDGKGYPRGLKGEEIDVLARIVSLADATQAMFGRSYAGGKTKEGLIAELNKCSQMDERGYQQFDPNITKYLINILENEKEAEKIGVTYNEDGKIIYCVKSVEEITRINQIKRQSNSFLASLQNEVIEPGEYTEGENENRYEKSKETMEYTEGEAQDL